MGQKVNYSLNDVFRASIDLMFPHYENRPSLFSQFSDHELISDSVFQQFTFPKITWQYIFPTRQSPSVPKITVKKNCFFIFWYSYVWFTNSTLKILFKFYAFL